MTDHHLLHNLRLVLLMSLALPILWSTLPGLALNHFHRNSGATTSWIVWRRRIGISVVVLIPIAYFTSPRSPAGQIALTFAAVLFPLLLYYAVSRRFEFEADEFGLQAVSHRKVAVEALETLYRRSEVPETCSKFWEKFLTHPTLARRVSRLRSLAETDTMTAATDK